MRTEAVVPLPALLIEFPFLGFGKRLAYCWRRAKLFRDRHLGYRMTEQLFYLIKFILLLLANECAGGTLRSSARRTAYAVNVIFAVMRYIVIDHQVYIFNINAAAQ